MEDKTLRDEFAMSMPADHIPSVSDQAGVNIVSKVFGIQPFDANGSDEGKVKWALRMEAAARYAYADAMMEARAKRK